MDPFFSFSRCAFLLFLKPKVQQYRTIENRNKGEADRGGTKGKCAGAGAGARLIFSYFLALSFFRTCVGRGGMTEGELLNWLYSRDHQ